MAINLNLDKYGDQFRAFVNFANANANNADTLACIQGDAPGGLLDPDGKPRTIVAKTDDDRIKSLRKNQFFNRNDDQKALNNSVRDLFKETVLKVCGVNTIDDLPPSVLAVMRKGDYEVDGGHPLSVRRIRAVTDAIRVLDAGPIPITGNTAKEITDLLLPGSGLEKAKHPGFMLKERMTKCATASVQTLVANGIAYLKNRDGDLDLDKYTDTFQRDIERRYPARFNDGQPIYTLGAAKARDAYVDFLTDGEVKTYAEADARTKIKANALMMLTMQGFGGCAIKSVGNAFDANGSTSRLSVGGGKGERIDYINVTKDAAGNITVQNDITYDSPVLVVMDGKNVPRPHVCGEGSSLAYHLKVTVDAESLDRLADADWKNFDSEEIKQTEADITRPYPTENAADALPADMKLNVAVDVSFSIHADNIEM